MNAEPMIKNERQYRVTRSQMRHMAKALAAQRSSRTDYDTHVYRAMVAGIESQIGELQRQITAYEALRGAAAGSVSWAADLPAALIQARIARGLSHQELASRLGVTAQQIQKYERDSYRVTSLGRVVEILHALGGEFTGTVTLTANTRPPRRHRQSG